MVCQPKYSLRCLSDGRFWANVTAVQSRFIYVGGCQTLTWPPSLMAWVSRADKHFFRCLQGKWKFDLDAQPEAFGSNWEWPANWILFIYSFMEVLLSVLQRSSITARVWCWWCLSLRSSEFVADDDADQLSLSSLLRTSFCSVAAVSDINIQRNAVLKGVSPQEIVFVAGGVFYWSGDCNLTALFQRVVVI